MSGCAHTDISVTISSINVNAPTLTIGLDSTRPEEIITGPRAVSNHSMLVILSFYMERDGGTGSSIRVFYKSVVKRGTLVAVAVA